MAVRIPERPAQELIGLIEVEDAECGELIERGVEQRGGADGARATGADVAGFEDGGRDGLILRGVEGVVEVEQGDGGALAHGSEQGERAGARDELDACGGGGQSEDAGGGDGVLARGARRTEADEEEATELIVSDDRALRIIGEDELGVGGASGEVGDGERRDEGIVLNGRQVESL
jgi:hypothetical protein